MKTGLRILLILWASVVAALSDGVPALVILDSGVSSRLVARESGQLHGAFISGKLMNLQSVKDEVSVNLVDPELAPDDRLGHGTHLSGLLWAEQNALRDNPPPCLVMIKVGDEKFSAPKLIEGLGEVKELRTKGLEIKIVLCAFELSRGDCSAEEFVAFETGLKELLNQGVVVVAAAGNQGLDLDQIEERARILPAGLKHENLVVVAAANEAGLMASRSNFGKESVWLAAEGVQLESLGIDGSRKKRSGSSQAAAIVAGQLFDQLIQSPKLKWPETKEAFERRARRHPSLTLTTKSGKFITRTPVE